MKFKTTLHHGGSSLPVAALAAGLVAAALAPSTVTAAPALRFKTDQKGDFVLFGNTVGRDCAAGIPAPVVGTVGACGMNVNDTAPDVFWRSDEPAIGQAAANVMITPAQARSTAMLRLPVGAQVSHARLYWSAARMGAVNDTNVVVERVGAGAFSQSVNADATINATGTTNPLTFYQSSADVTQLLRTNGAGAYRVSGIDTPSLAGVVGSREFIAWWMVVLYTLDSDPPRNIAIFDGLDMIEPTTPAITVTVSGFLVPDAGFDAKLGVVAYEGDASLIGDQLSFNDPTFAAPLFNTLNPVDNFFNGTRTFEAKGMPATAVSNVGDLPQLTGTQGSMSGIDMDVVDVTGRVKKGDTQATVSMRTTGDFIILGALITSISTFKPDFSTTNKSFVNLNNRPNGAIRPGDIIEYTITTTNTGNDPGVNVLLTDDLPTGVTFVDGSIRITDGANLGTKTDAIGDDQGEVTMNKRRVLVRLGAGANGTTGGTLAVNATTTIKFQVSIDGTATGMIANQAVITAAGQTDTTMRMYPSDGNGPQPGTPPTNFPVDQCLTDTDCTPIIGKPLCRNEALQHPWICVECKASTDCQDAAKPFCDPTTNACRSCSTDADCTTTPNTPACLNGACTECALTNRTRCMTMAGKPVCLIPPGACGCNTNADCPVTAPTCDPTTKACKSGCKTDPDCAATPATPACSVASGTCVECTTGNTSKCVAPKPACDIAASKCVECLAATDCPATTPVCDTTMKTCRKCTMDNECPAARPLCSASGACVLCRTNAECGGTTPLCSSTSGSCGPCVDDGAPSCSDPKFPACQKGGPLAGSCTECSGTNVARCGGIKPVCLTTFGFCGCTDTMDSVCGGPMSGIVCNAPVGICIPGCSNAANRNKCPVDQMCMAMGDAVGTCTMVAACMIDADCKDPRPKCDTNAMPRSCVQCLADGDCKAPSICDAGKTKSCVECTPGNVTNCSVNGSGTRCLDNSTCGCQFDNECGGMRSGRVCDTGLSKCSPGCRGVNGNTCPGGLVCTSMTMDIGRCVPAGSPLDAGLMPDARIADALVEAPGTDASDSARDAATDAPMVDAPPPAPDRPVAMDMRPTPEPDAEAPAPDAEAPTVGYVAGGGCQCEIGAPARSAAADRGFALWLAIVPVGLAVVGRRRRRR